MSEAGVHALSGMGSGDMQVSHVATRGLDTSHGVVLYLEGISVSFDGFKALNGLSLAIDDFDPISARTPVLADLKPGGRFTAVDMARAGGVRLLVKRMLDAGILPIYCTKGSTSVRVGRFQSFAQPPRALAGRWER